MVSAEWVAAATARYVVPDGNHGFAQGYGFGWWHYDLTVGGRAHHAYFAAGWGEQMIFVLPDDDMVVVTTGAATTIRPPCPPTASSPSSSCRR